MKITKKIWEQWRKEGDKALTESNILVKKVKKIKENMPDIKPPECFVNIQEFQVLYALNGYEQTITQIYRKTTMGYSDVHKTVYKLADRGLVTIIGKKKHKMGKYIKATQEGINILINWQGIHLNKL